MLLLCDWYFAQVKQSDISPVKLLSINSNEKSVCVFEWLFVARTETHV